MTTFLNEENCFVGNNACVAEYNALLFQPWLSDSRRAGQGEMNNYGFEWAQSTWHFSTE